MASADRTRIHVRAVRRRLLTGPPLSRVLPWRSEGLPGVWIVLLLRAVVVHPAGCVLSSPYCAESAFAFEESDPLGTRNASFSWLRSPRPIRSHAYASPTTLPCSAQGLLPAGRASPFAGRELHPLDDKPNFMRSPHLPLPSDQPCLVAPLIDPHFGVKIP